MLAFLAIVGAPAAAIALRKLLDSVASDGDGDPGGPQHGNTHPCAAADAWFSAALAQGVARSNGLVNGQLARNEWNHMSCDEKNAAMLSGPVFINYLLAKYALSSGLANNAKDWIRKTFGHASADPDGVAVGNESNGVEVDSDGHGSASVGGHKIASW